MPRLNTLKFLIVSALIVGGVNYLQHQAALQQEKLDLLLHHLDDLTFLYEHTARELRETNKANRELKFELDEALQRIETVEKRNEQLEQLLFNQRQTYCNAVALSGSTMPVLSISSFTAKQYERAWVRLGAHGLRGTGAALVRAEEIYGINSLALASIAYLESAGGMSRIAREKNNLFGLGAFDGNPILYAYTFSTKDDSIYYAAQLLSNSYLSRWGRNYSGDNLVAIGVRYASDPQWAEKVGRAMSLIARAAIPEGR